MHVDLESSELTDLVTDVCIVGAGVAGITMARRLLALGHKVVILESGGIDYEPAAADLNAGESTGHPYYDLAQSRLRFFGGTAAIWGGRVAELDPIDFQSRPWVPYSGWPIAYEQLRSYYDQAWRSLQLPALHPGNRLAEFKAATPAFDENELELRFWAFDDRSNRFGFRSNADLRDHPDCLILTHATATEIVTDGAGAKVERLIVRAAPERECRIRARAFVLAAGGIENARLLLASRQHSPAGVGNAHGLVGRFFMEHPHARGGRILATKSWQLLNAFGRSHRVAGRRLAALITAAPARQAALGMLNTSLTIAPRQPAGATQFAAMRLYNKAKHELAPTRTSRALWRQGKKAVTSLQMVADPLRPWLMNRLGMLDIALLVRAEQSPNPDSRVMLSDEKDALGIPRVKLDWRLNELDKHSVVQLVGILSRECERLGLGTVEPAGWLASQHEEWRTDRTISAHPIGGYHHMGTTRMAASDRQGVTDSHGNVFGVHNLFVAGSSLFPTSGWANPTLTLMALALRTGEYISQRLHEPEAKTVHAAEASAYR